MYIVTLQARFAGNNKKLLKYNQEQNPAGDLGWGGLGTSYHPFVLSNKKCNENKIKPQKVWQTLDAHIDIDIDIDIDAQLKILPLDLPVKVDIHLFLYN